MCDQGALPCLPHSLPQSTQAACRHKGYNPSLVACSVWPFRVLSGCDFLLCGQSRSQMSAATADRRVVSSPRTGGAVSESRAAISNSCSLLGWPQSQAVSLSVTQVCAPPHTHTRPLICGALHISALICLIGSSPACAAPTSTPGNWAHTHNPVPDSLPPSQMLTTLLATNLARSALPGRTHAISWKFRGLTD